MANHLTCLKCGRRTVSETVKVSVGKLVSGEWEKWRQYEGPTLEIPVCRRCFQFYHIKEDIFPRYMRVLLLIAAGYAVWGYVAGGFQLAFAYAVVVFLGLLVVAYPIYWLVEKICGALWPLESFAEKHPQYAELTKAGFTEVFYVDRQGKPQTKDTKP